MHETNGRHHKSDELQMNFEVETTEEITVFSALGQTVYLLLWIHWSEQNIELSLTVNFHDVRSIDALIGKRTDMKL